MASNTLKDWTAKPADLNTGAARKFPRTAHQKLNDSAVAAFADSCGPVEKRRGALPPGLDSEDVPFSVTPAGGLAAQNKNCVPLDDWRKEDAAAVRALEFATRAVLIADKYGAEVDSRIAAAIAAKNLCGRFDSHIYAWIESSEKEKATAVADAANKKLLAARETIRYNAGVKYRAHKKVLAARGAAGADAWQVVDAGAVADWLRAAPWSDTLPPLVPLTSPYNPEYTPRLSDSQRLRGVPPVAVMWPDSPYNAAYMPRLSFAQRCRLYQKRAALAVEVAVKLAEIAAAVGADSVAEIPRINHYISILPPVGSKYYFDFTGGHGRTETAQAIITEFVRRAGVQALSTPIKKTGNPYLLELKNQQYEIDSRNAAAAQAYNALIGGAVKGAAVGAPTGSGGMRYRISVKETRATGGARIVYRRRKKKNSLGGFSNTALPLVEKSAAAASMEALDKSVCGRSMTELDAIINSCCCPSIPDDSRAAQRIEKSLLYVLDRDCVELSDIARGYFWARAKYGAKNEMDAEKSETAKARRAGVVLESMDALKEDAADGGAAADIPGAADVDFTGVTLENLCGIARGAATRGRADDFEKLIRLLAAGNTQADAACKIGITKQAAGQWYKKILAACRAAGADSVMSV